MFVYLYCGCVLHRVRLSVKIMAKQSYIKSLFSNFAAAGKKSLSVELYSHLPYDLEAFYKINPSFCSITWAHGDLSNFDGLSTIALCRKLNQNSTNVIMHVGGKKFNRVEALTTFQKMKEMGVKHILAIRGGKYYLHTVRILDCMSGQNPIAYV